MKRELNGIKRALVEAGAEEGIKITHDQEDTIDGIRLIPAWKWI